MSHAILSPSSAARWINCPPSAKINAQAPQQDTAYTREGTLAHAVAELKARKYFLTGIGPRKFTIEMNKLKADESWQDEMDGYTDDYLDALKDIAEGYPEAPYVALEQKVDFSEYVPEGFGTADCIMIGRGDPSTTDAVPSHEGRPADVLNVVDFKYGKGVAVSAEENPQMMLYALGALANYELIYDIGLIRMTIVQPRIKAEPDTWTITPERLREWAEGVVKPAAALAAKGEGEFAEGAWCRFCAIRGSCRARAAANTALEDFGLRQPPELTDAEVAQALSLGQRLSEWLKDIEEYALGACLDGREIPGWKAVAGRSVRAWTDQDAAFKAAREGGVPDEMLYDRRPVTLAGLEKILGKKQFGAILAEYVTTPPGKPTLAKADDKRAAITGRPAAKDDFEELPF